MFKVVKHVYTSDAFALKSKLSALPGLEMNLNPETSTCLQMGQKALFMPLVAKTAYFINISLIKAIFRKYLMEKC